MQARSTRGGGWKWWRWLQWMPPALPIIVDECSEEAAAPAALIEKLFIYARRRRRVVVVLHGSLNSATAILLQLCNCIANSLIDIWMRLYPGIAESCSEPSPHYHFLWTQLIADDMTFYSFHVIILSCSAATNSIYLPIQIPHGWIPILVYYLPTYILYVYINES